MKILIIGANGFLGKNLAEKCLKNRWEVTCSYNKKQENIPKNCLISHIDKILNDDKKYDIIFLIAAFIPYKDLNSNNLEMLNTNIFLPYKIINKFSDSKIIFSSSVSVYGIHNNSIINESTCFNNPNLYGLSKISAECILKFHNNYQIIRFSSIFGRGMNNNTFLPSIINDFKKKKKIILFGEGSRLQNYIHIKDAVDICIKSAVVSEKNNIFLGVYNKSYSNKEVANIIGSYSKDCDIEYKGIDNSPSFIYDNKFTKSKLNFEPLVSLEEGLKDLL